MLKGAVARRYAEAVMEIAQQQGTVERWLADVRLIGEAFGNRRLAFVLKEPKIPMSRKQLIVRDLLANKVQRDALNLALVLTEDGITEVGPRLAQEFETLYDDYRGQAKALVTTAMQLDDAERSKIAQALQRITGRRIILEERIDPDILGGVIARVGDTLIDGSVRRRLALLREQIVKGGGSFGGPSDGRSEPDGGPEGGPQAGGGSFVVQPAMPPADEPAEADGSHTGSSPTAGGSPDGSAPGPSSMAQTTPRAPSVVARPKSSPGGQSTRRGKQRGRRR